ncbi:hypothetical protein [Paraburkholderia sp. SIMBA_054]|uniref:hypothetical protein n=1 Tax=Paraburkholderia sp. SIMBA_054 TaxID=3085795 RepID=UPI00397C7BF3
MRRNVKGNIPCGLAIAFERSRGRYFSFEITLYLPREYRLDGLRLDAVHAINDGEWPAPRAGSAE